MLWCGCCGVDVVVWMLWCGCCGVDVVVWMLWCGYCGVEVDGVVCMSALKKPLMISPALNSR